MPIIKLTPEITNRIAAGEVVERPAAIIKELLENSLDAGAQNITIEMEDGGCRAVKIIDDGAGIAARDLPLAILRHATSKITTFEDIYRLATFGFRGEALSSIASVARVEIVSKVAEEISGARIIVANGGVVEQEPCGSPNGTAISITAIFEEIPARKKFLRSAAMELASSLETVARVALSVPTVRFRVLNNGKEVAFYPSCADIISRASVVLGKAFTAQVLPVALETEGFGVTGIISPPDKTSANAKNILIYVNNRFVKDYLVQHAISGAYRRMIEHKRYPYALVFITVPPADVDVNVHPAKREVRWRNPRELYDAVSRAIGKAIAPQEELTTTNKEHITDEAGAYKHRVEEALRRYATTHEASPQNYSFAADKQRGYNQPSPHPAPKAPPIGLQGTAEEKTTPQGENSVLTLAASSFPEWRYLGALRDTYLLLEDADGLMIIDQHAAHERIVFEHLRRASQTKKAKVQELLVPEVITLPRGEANALCPLLPHFTDIGFIIEQFGMDTFIVKGVPDILAQAPPAKLISDVLAEALAVAGKPSIDEWRERILTICACTEAVKARMALSRQEIDSLIAQISGLGSQITCPHGRPLLIRIGIAALERMFKRR
ncbi:MAG: DNA mismatch repair endonuclease MutL [Deltaproteobacteria bacterium]|nr:DNA mismatch repair endonuclease MutL [Deltaproteobacteria bacterium]